MEKRSICTVHGLVVNRVCTSKECNNLLLCPQCQHSQEHNIKDVQELKQYYNTMILTEQERTQQREIFKKIKNCALQSLDRLERELDILLTFRPSFKLESIRDWVFIDEISSSISYLPYRKELLYQDINRLYSSIETALLVLKQSHSQYQQWTSPSLFFQIPNQNIDKFAISRDNQKILVLEDSVNQIYDIISKEQQQLETPKLQFSYDSLYLVGCDENKFISHSKKKQLEQIFPCEIRSFVIMNSHFTLLLFEQKIAIYMNKAKRVLKYYNLQDYYQYISLSNDKKFIITESSLTVTYWRFDLRGLTKHCEVDNYLGLIKEDYLIYGDNINSLIMLYNCKSKQLVKQINSQLGNNISFNKILISEDQDYFIVSAYNSNKIKMFSFPELDILQEFKLEQNVIEIKLQDKNIFVLHPDNAIYVISPFKQLYLQQMHENQSELIMTYDKTFMMTIQGSIMNKFENHVMQSYEKDNPHLMKCSENFFMVTNKDTWTGGQFFMKDFRKEECLLRSEVKAVDYCLSQDETIGLITTGEELYWFKVEEDQINLNQLNIQGQFQSVDIDKGNYKILLNRFDNQASIYSIRGDLLYNFKSEYQKIKYYHKKNQIIAVQQFTLDVFDADNYSLICSYTNQELNALNFKIYREFFIVYTKLHVKLLDELTKPIQCFRLPKDCICFDFSQDGTIFVCQNSQKEIVEYKIRN